ncbi:hypothetical protein HZA33_04940 [Candidatus Pacearchaeota archaeon]|nr:hypothetical protein [Candidatus Pacearchaeota archaeon]
MTNLIVGLKYQPKYGKIETEEQLLEIFSDLKENYSKFKQNFSITSDGKSVNLKEFLKIAVDDPIANAGKFSRVVLSGSGDIGGIVVKDASLEYDLSSVSSLTKYWNIYQDKSCFSCTNQYTVLISQDESEARCKKINDGRSPGQVNRNHDCANYSAYLKNSEGKPARQLDALIEEALK